MTDEQQEKDIQNLIKQYSMQQSSFLNNPKFAGKPAQGIDSHTGIDNQGIINESTPITSSTLTPSKPPSPIPISNVCPQCNMVHPPIRPGTKCPNALVKSMTEENTEVIVDVNKYLTNLRNILMNNVDKKKIKNINKLFQNITLEITKYLEVYKE